MLERTASMSGGGALKKHNAPYDYCSFGISESRIDHRSRLAMDDFTKSLHHPSLALFAFLAVSSCGSLLYEAARYT